MNTTTKLLIPIILGLAAAAVNWFAVNKQTNPVYFTAAKQELEPGAPILRQMVEKKALPRVYEGLDGTAVRWEDFGSVENSKVQRMVKAGDLIFYGDCARDQYHLGLNTGETAIPVSLAGIPVEPGVIRVGNEIDFLIPVERENEEIKEWIGPFRVVSVGTDFTARQDKNTGRGNSEKITVAIPLDSGSTPLHVRSKQLVDFLAEQNEGLARTLKLVRLHSR